MKKNLVNNFFNLNISRRKGFPQGEGDKMVALIMFLKGITFLRRRGTTSPNTKGTKLFWKTTFKEQVLERLRRNYKAKLFSNQIFIITLKKFKM
jgi:hypothetical protein